MAQMAIIILTNPRPRVATFSWTTGVIARDPNRWVIRNDNDAQAYALYLEKHGMSEEAQNFIDSYCNS